MKILYIACSCSPDYGSEDAVGWNIPFQAQKSGHEVYVIVRSGLRNTIEKYLRSNTITNAPKFYYIETSALLAKIAKGPLYTLRLYEFADKALQMARELNNQYAIDIIHQITPVEFRSIGDYGSISNVRYIVGPIAGGQKINRLLWCYSKDKLAEYVRLMMNELIIRSKKYRHKVKKAHTILFANYETKEFFEQHSLMNENCDVIPEIGVLRQKRNINLINRKKKVFLIVGRIISIKGIEIVLDALKYVDIKDYVIRICGEGKLKTEIQKRIDNEQLADKVELVGFVNYHRMKDEYDNAAALIMPSLREATGTVLVEAMSYHVPVITFEQFGARLILDNDSGWLIPVAGSTEDCVKNLAKAMEEVISMPEKAIQKGERAGDIILEYSWDKKYCFYEEIYKRALE